MLPSAGLIEVLPVDEWLPRLAIDV